MKNAGLRATVQLALCTPIVAMRPCGVASAAVRTYSIAADEINWNYLPGGGDKAAMAIAYARFFATRGPHLIGPAFRDFSRGTAWALQCDRSGMRGAEFLGHGRRLSIR